MLLTPPPTSIGAVDFKTTNPLKGTQDRKASEFTGPGGKEENGGSGRIAKRGGINLPADFNVEMVVQGENFG